MPELLLFTFKTIGSTLAAAALSVGLYLGYLQLGTNFAPVIAGELYRSAQLDAPDIRDYAGTYGIRSIINLRGENTGSDWYDAEITEARSLGIAHFDFAMSAKRELTQAQAATLIAMMKDAPKPLLIHCQAGADRSGLAAALYLAAVAKQGEEAAEAQLSLYFGHISLPVTGAYAMDRTFEGLEPWLGYPNS